MCVFISWIRCKKWRDKENKLHFCEGFFLLKKNSRFVFYLFKIFFIVLPSWFGEFLHRRSLLQVSYVLSWIFFSFFPLISTLLAPPSPDFCAWPPNSDSFVWQTLWSSQILITSLSPALSYVMKTEPVLLQGPLSAHFCWGLLHSFRSVCGKATLAGSSAVVQRQLLCREVL